MLRPERVELTADAEAASLPVTVQDIAVLGKCSTVAARTDWGDGITVQLTFGLPLASRIARGDRLHVRWSPKAAHAFVRR